MFEINMKDKNETNCQSLGTDLTSARATRKRPKSNRFLNKQENNFARAAHCFVHFVLVFV